MEQLITQALLPPFYIAGTLSIIMGISAKLINIFVKAFTRGELVV